MRNRVSCASFTVFRLSIRASGFTAKCVCGDGLVNSAQRVSSDGRHASRLHRHRCANLRPRRANLRRRCYRRWNAANCHSIRRCLKNSSEENTAVENTKAREHCGSQALAAAAEYTKEEEYCGFPALAAAVECNSARSGYHRQDGCW